MKGLNIIFDLVRRRGDLFGCLVIVLFVLLLGLQLGAWTGDLKGDDAYYHVGMIQYIVDNFPNLSWYHQSFAGYPPFQFEAPLYYFVIALAHVGTGLSIELLIQLGLILFMVALGLSIYTLARFLSFSRILAIGFALLIFTVPEIWNWIVIGAGYKRLIALPFFFFSLAFVYRHLNEINSDSEKTRTYCAVVVTLSFTAMLHPLIGQVTLPMALLVYVLGVRAWPRKFYYLAKTFVPVAGLAAWLYLPLLRVYTSVTSPVVEGAYTHDTALMQWGWLLTIPSPGSWANTIGPLMLPLALFCLILIIIEIRKAWHSFRVELSFVIIAAGFGLYFLAFGWLPMPKSLHLMGTFDNVMWLGISLLLLSAFSLSILAKLGIFPRLKKWLRLSAQTFLVILVVAATVANIPFLQHYTQQFNPLNPTSFTYQVRRVVDIAKENSLPGYRLHNSQRRVQAWLYFVYPELETTDGRSKNSAPHKYYHQWANLAVSYRFESSYLRTGEVYFEDTPQVMRDSIGGEENFYSSVFWLDWYGASGPILMPTIYLQNITAENYGNRPQFFQEYKVVTRYGDMFFYKYTDSSPMLVSPQVYVVAVLFSPEDAPPFYTDFLDVLSSLNLNSQYIIPVKLEDGQALEHFDTALVDYEGYIQNKDALEGFVQEGGHLVVMGVGNGEPNLVNAELLRTGLSLQVEATSLEAPEASTTLAEADEGVLIYRKNIGQGAVTFSGLSMHHLVESNSPVGAVLLMEMIEPESGVNQIGLEVTASTVSWTTDGTIAATRETGNILNWAVSWHTDKAEGEVNTTSAYEELIAKFYGGDAHDQVNFSAYLLDQVSVKSAGFVEFEIWCDEEPRIDVSFASSGKWNAYPVRIKKGEWVHNLIPLSAFQFPVGDFDLSSELTFVVNDNPEAGLIGDGDRVEVRVRNLRIRTSEEAGEWPVLQWVADYGREHNQVNWKLPLPWLLSAGDNALLNFSLWHDGEPVTGIDIILEQEEKKSFLYYTLHQPVWEGWRNFSIPLSAFQWKEGWEQIQSFDSIVIVLNQDPPYPKESVIREFITRDIKITSLKAPPTFVKLEGEWLQANKFKVALKGHREVLWKESYTPSWKVKADNGRAVDYYFAGPGMMYLVAPEDAQELIFEMPVPLDVLLGLGISVVFFLGFMYYTLARTRGLPLPHIKVKQ